MNRRRLLVTVVLVVAAGASIRFSAQQEVPASPADEGLRPTAVAPRPFEPIPGEAVAEVGDAGAASGVITIAVERDGKPEVGPRLVLRNAAGDEVSRTTDVMGTATFTLSLGEWLVMRPEGLAGERVEVTEEPRHVTLTLRPLLRVEGTVLDERGAPAADVPVTRLEPQLTIGTNRFSLTALGEPLDPSNILSGDVDSDDVGEEVARTDAAGHFAFDSVEESVVLRASRGAARAVLETGAPARDLTLRLEEVAWLTVVAPSRGQAIVSLQFRTGRVVRQLDGEVRLRLPVGEVQSRALTVERGQLLRASQRVVVKGGEKNELRLAFSEAPPVSGVVLDARGAPVPGVTVGLALAPSNPGSVPRSQEQAVTDARGRFALVPRLIRGGDPLYEVHLLPPWKEKRVVQVRLGDAPVTVEAK